MKHIFLSILAFVIAVVLCGCGNNGTFLDDFLVLTGSSMSQIDNYFELNQEQKKKLDNDLNNDLNRLRAERFKQIAKSLRNLEKKSDQPGNAKFLSSSYDEVQQIYKESSPYFRDSTQNLVFSLSDLQFSGFQTKLRKEINESRKSLPAAREMNDELKDRYQIGLQYWFGDLREDQKDLLAKFVQEKRYPWKEKLKNKESLLESFDDARTNNVKMKKFVSEYISDYDSLRIPEYANAVDTYQKDLHNFLDSFWQTVSPEQKRRMQAYLLTRADKLETLAKNH